MFGAASSSPSFSPRQDRLNRWAELNPHTVTLFSTPADVTYFTGFEFLLPAEREAFVVVTVQAEFHQTELWYASFSPLPTDIESSGVIAQPMKTSGALLEHLQQLVTDGKLTTLQFDASNLTVAEYDRLKTISDLKLVPLNRQQVWQLRQQKDAAELPTMKKACQITSEILDEIMATLQPGMTEQTVAWELENKLRQAGVSHLAFPTIVAFGDHTALPHHQPTQRKLELEMAVLIDVGGKYQGYCADMTRSIWFGSKPPAKYQLIEKTVQGAYIAAFNWVKAELAQNHTVTGKDIDTQARNFITQAGFGPEFIHTTGHGIGLEVHEPPSVSWHNTEAVLPDTCLTIEPGIYLVGEFGYRYENTVHLTSTTAVELTH